MRHHNLFSHQRIAFAIVGGVYFYSGLLVARELSRAHARRVLLASIVYLPVLYGLMMADRTSL